MQSPLNSVLYCTNKEYSRVGILTILVMPQGKSVSVEDGFGNTSNVKVHL